MRRKFLGWSGLICLLVLFGFTWSKSNKCSQAKDCGGYRRTSYSTPNGKHEETFWEWTTRDPVALYTFWLAVFTAGLTVASIWQGFFLIRADRTARTAADAALATANAMAIQNIHIENSITEARRAADAMGGLVQTTRETAERQLRAYVNATTESPYPNVSAEIRISTVIGVNIFMRNFGRTPAYNVDEWMNIQIREIPLASDLPEPSEMDKFLRGRSVISPGQVATISAVTTWAISASDRRDIIAGKKAIYIYGKILYSDIFGEKKRITTYRFFSRSVAESTNNFQIYDDGNDAT